MLVTHGNFYIEVGLAQRCPDGRFTVAWAVYPSRRELGPVYAGTTTAFNNPDMAVAIACAEARAAAET
jgi:hypothetical protein